MHLRCRGSVRLARLLYYRHRSRCSSARPSRLRLCRTVGRALGMQAAIVLPDREHLLRLRGVDATAAQSDLAESPNSLPRGMKAATAQSDQHIYCVTGHECHRSSVRLAISVCHLITFVQRLNHGAT